MEQDLKSKEEENLSHDHGVIIRMSLYTPSMILRVKYLFLLLLVSPNTLNEFRYVDDPSSRPRCSGPLCRGSVCRLMVRRWEKVLPEILILIIIIDDN